MKNIMIVVAFLLLTTGVYMATHDIGTGDNRTNAMPNVHDAMAETKADGTQGITQKVNTTSGAYVKTKDAQIVVNNGTVDSISLGRQSDQTYGMRTSDGTNTRLSIASDGTIKISKAGFDASTTTDANLIFNSNQNMFKIVLSGTATLSYDGVVTTYVTIPHNLGIIPIVMAYVKFPNDANFSPMAGQYVPMPVYQLRTGLPAVQCIQSADSTNVYLRVHDVYATVPSPEVYTFRYYIMQETAN